MKELFQKMMKKLRKHSEAAGAIAALLLIVLFSGVMILGIRTQRKSVPENPIDGMKKSSMVMLTGTKEVLAEQTKENGSSRQQMQNQQNMQPFARCPFQSLHRPAALLPAAELQTHPAYKSPRIKIHSPAAPGSYKKGTLPGAILFGKDGPFRPA